MHLLADARALEHSAGLAQQVMAAPAAAAVLADATLAEPTAEQLEAMEKAREVTGNKWAAYLIAWAGWLAWDLWRQQQQKQGEQAGSGGEVGSAGSTDGTQPKESPGGSEDSTAADKAGVTPK